jgi:adenylate cyclase
MTMWLRSLRRQAAPPPAVGVVRPATGSLAIVVRPSMEGDQREAAAARSLTSELVTALSAVPGYRIASQPTGAVDFLIDGTVQRQGKVLRVNLRFVDARRDSTMWAVARQGSLDDLFSLQDSVTSAAAAALRGAMR